MGLILIVLAVLVIAVVAIIVITKASNKYYNYRYGEREEKATKFEQFCYQKGGDYTFGGWVAIVVAGILLVSMLGGVIGETVQAEALKARYVETYNSLIYKMESTTCRDEFGFLNKEVIDEVTEWNETISYKKIAQDNIWVGCFTPDIYDDFELIDYMSFVPKETK